MKTRLIALLLSFVMILCLGACGNAQDTGQGEGESGAVNAAADIPAAEEEVPAEAPADGTVVVENMGRTTVYEAAPQTAVALSYSIAEIMVALGLEDKIVAIAPSMYILDQVSLEYRDIVGSFPVLEGNYGVPSLETVPDTNAEFVFGDFYAFYATSIGTAEDFENAGVKVYATEGTCVSNPTFENTYHDIMNIGRIFRVEDRAEVLVVQLRQRETAGMDAVAGDRFVIVSGLAMFPGLENLDVVEEIAQAVHL